MILRALYCPSCGARLEAEPGARKLTCTYCEGSLLVEPEEVRHVARPPATHKPEDPYAPPDSRLFQHRTDRFELSVLEQLIPEAGREVFAPVPLDEGRFAIYYLRLTDEKGRSLPRDPRPAAERLAASLAEDSDPGLAAYTALEFLAEDGYCDGLETAIALFEPDRSRVLIYNAGCGDCVWWVSHEEGRCVTSHTPHRTLERRMLRESRDYFSNASPVYLAAGDLVVLLSAGFAGRGGGPYSSGLGRFTDTLNRHIGEDPLRVVTLAKNSYWESRSPADRANPPSGHIRVAAVRALPPPLAEAPPGAATLYRGRSFETALWLAPGDVVLELPLHADRRALLWLSGHSLDAEAVELARKAVVDVLDRPNHGDNENPREAGRRALEHLPEGTKLALIQLFEEYRRVKYFRHGWKQAIGLGPRGVHDSDGMQQFDEGGEATVREGSRLFFPGALDYPGQFSRATDLAEAWWGGKASRLYEALTAHWRTRRTDKALEGLVRAALSDRPGASAGGLGLVTGVP